MKQNVRKVGVITKRQKELIRKKRRKNRIMLVITGIALAFSMFCILDMKAQLKEMKSLLGEMEPGRQKPAGGMENVTASETENKQKEKQKAIQEKDYMDGIPSVKVEKPREYSREEAVEKLRELGENNSVVEKILNNSDLYPENMLAALANNLEMTDFVAGYTDEGQGVAGGLTESEKEQDFPLFLQWDKRWGYHSYGSSIVGLTGCGPTCLSMVLYYLLRDETLTPDKIADYAMDNGYWVEGSGTAWQLMDDVPAIYGLMVGNIQRTEEAMLAALERGSVLICSVGRGDFTVYGHFIVIYGYNEEGFLVNDPNCVDRSGRYWTFDQIGAQIKNIWAYERL